KECSRVHSHILDVVLSAASAGDGRGYRTSFHGGRQRDDLRGYHKRRGVYGANAGAAASDHALFRAQPLKQLAANKNPFRHRKGFFLIRVPSAASSFLPTTNDRRPQGRTTPSGPPQT